MIPQESLLRVMKTVWHHIDSWASFIVRWAAITGLVVAAYSAVTSTASNWIESTFNSAVTQIFDDRLDGILESFYVDEVIEAAQDEANRVATGEVARVLERIPYDYGGLYPQTYSWRSGIGAQQMIGVNEGVCFLTRVSGKFEERSDNVSVFDSSGYWHLGGDSFRNSIGADAKCWKFPERTQTRE